MLALYDPLGRALAMRDIFDRLFEEMTAAVSRERVVTRAFRGRMPLDVTEQKDAFIVKATLPGFAPENVDITVTDNVLTIKATASETENVDDSSYHLKERYYGSCFRQIELPIEVDANNAKATFQHGVLTLTLPKAAKVEPKTIKVETKTE